MTMYRRARRRYRRPRRRGNNTGLWVQGLAPIQASANSSCYTLQTNTGPQSNELGHNWVLHNFHLTWAVAGVQSDLATPIVKGYARGWMALYKAPATDTRRVAQIAQDFGDTSKEYMRRKLFKFTPWIATVGSTAQYSMFVRRISLPPAARLILYVRNDFSGSDNYCMLPMVAHARITLTDALGNASPR